LENGDINAGAFSMKVAKIYSLPSTCMSVSPQEETRQPLNGLVQNSTVGCCTSIGLHVPRLLKLDINNRHLK